MFAWTLTLQGIRLDLKNDFTLELGSVQPNGGNSGGPLSACLAQLLSHEPGPAAQLQKVPHATGSRCPGPGGRGDSTHAYRFAPAVPTPFSPGGDVVFRSCQAALRRAQASAMQSKE